MTWKTGTFGRLVFLCLFPRRKGSHYSLVDWSSTLLLPLCCFPTWVLVHSGFWVSRSTSVVDPSGWPFSLSLSLSNLHFPSLSFHTRPLSLSSLLSPVQTKMLKWYKTNMKKKRPFKITGPTQQRCAHTLVYTHTHTRLCLNIWKEVICTSNMIVQLLWKAQERQLGILNGFFFLYISRMDTHVHAF